ncbi:MAG: hypothetical protein QF473_33360, partial [Planctomycetota bacterium]|nr:hypothetical protein [Planctomycetota bacterium]
MGNQTETEEPVVSPAGQAGNANHFVVHPSDRELFQKHLHSFVPPGAFDAHAHVYDLRHISPGTPEDAFGGSPEITISRIQECTGKWMGDRVIRDGLYFPFPIRGLDASEANLFLATDLKNHSGSRGLMIVRPQDDPDAIEAVEWRYGKLPEEGRPELEPWLTDLKANPEEAPAVLRRWLQP